MEKKEESKTTTKSSWRDNVIYWEGFRLPAPAKRPREAHKTFYCFIRFLPIQQLSLMLSFPKQKLLGRKPSHQKSLINSNWLVMFDSDFPISIALIISEETCQIGFGCKASSWNGGSVNVMSCGSGKMGQLLMSQWMSRDVNRILNQGNDKVIDT